ncbi:hypothetical protein [Campylobacter lari]|uniref:hypothetical protein n=1 Tax=Campylobacter lari TaxID=201 RepID=UPI00372AF632
MTCYLHIGTPKTGTTSIQEFLEINRIKLLQQKIYYPSFFSNKESWKFPKVCKIENTNSYYAANVSKNIDEHAEILNLFRQEISKNNCCSNILLSSECFYEFLKNTQDLRFLKQTLMQVGFTDFYIILYIREPIDLLISFYNTELLLNRRDRCELFENHNTFVYYGKHIANYKKNINNWMQIFGREKLIVRLFNKDEFYQGDLLKDFIHSIGLDWDNTFVMPKQLNKTINLLGIELTKCLNLKLGNVLRDKIQQHFSFKDAMLNFQPPKEIIQSYIDYFEESNEWVRKEFFPHKERLFPKKDLSNYKENYELKEMKPEYWYRIAEFVADIVETKNKIISDKIVLFQNLKNTLNKNIKEKDQIINSKSIKLNRLQSKLSFQTKYGTAKTRIQNQLSYKLGQVMMVNSKSFLGYLIMPMALLSIMISHKQEQKIYQEKIKKDPSLKLPPLESYPDYQEALKEKECLTYKLGQALTQANKTWYKGGYVKLWFEIGELKREYRNKVNHV